MIAALQSSAFEIGGWTLLDPWFLLAVPVAVLVWLHRLWRPRAALPAASAQLLEGLPRTLRARMVHAPAAGKVLACCLLGIALARPVQREVLPLREEGVDIMLVLDVSSSMTLQDMEQGSDLRRVDAARQRAMAFAAARVTDRVGLVTFARFPELVCPLTLDEDALAVFLRQIDTVPQQSALDGTDIGSALAKAVDLLDDGEAASKVVVMLTDGETTYRVIQPLDAAQMAEDAGIRVHTIGLGNGVPSPFGGMQAPDFREIEKVAEVTGGRFFRARSDADLEQVYEEIDRLEKVPLEDPRYRTMDAFALPLLAGLGVLLLALLLEFLWIREAP